MNRPPLRAPLSPAEIARRAQAAATRPEDAGCADDCVHPSHRTAPSPVASEAWPTRSTEFVEAAPIDTWVCDEHGLVRWVPAVHRIDVVQLPGGACVLVVAGVRIKLDPECREHLGRLLLGKHAP